MKYFVDTEFNEFLGELISIAIVAEDDRWFYCEAQRTQDDRPWVAKHVIPLLTKTPASREEIQLQLKNLLGGDQHVEFIADWPSDLEFVANLLTLPGGERLGPRRVTLTLQGGFDTYPVTPHHALSDAWALKAAYQKKFL